MTDKQEMKVRRNAYKFYDEVIYEHRDWNKRDIALASFQAGADYVLKNKHELKEEQSNAKPNIVQFLKDNGAYEMFFANLLNYKQEKDLGKYFLSDFFSINAISAAFIWSETPEGKDLWCELGAKWRQLF
jgi:hypothetical protein